MYSARSAEQRDLRTVLDGIRRIVRHLRESSRAAEKRTGVGAAQLFVLQVLARERALSVNELAARTMTHQSSVSGVVARLVQTGLVNRTRSLADARRCELAVTARGRALLRRAPEATQERLIEGIGSLPAPQREQLAAGLTALVGGMGLAAMPPTMFFHDASTARVARRPRGQE